VIEMGRGGARNRSGPQPDPTSGRSDRRNYKLTALPASGYDGEIPPFPLPLLKVFNVYFVEKQKISEFDEKATVARADREVELWAWAWRTPLGCAWSMMPWRWHTVAMWVRTAVLCESAEATAADKGSLHRFADQIGWTPAGLKENGWAIAPDELSEKRAEQQFEDDPDDPRGRFTVIQGAG
jgi:hypothetical protein